MGQFIITGPDGKKYKVTGSDPAGAVAALKKALGMSTGAADPAAQRRADMVGRIDAAKAGTLKMSPQRAAEQTAIDDQAEVTMRDPGAIMSAVSGAAQGATFGFADELAARIVSASPDITYEEALESARALQRDALAARPVTNTGANIVGAIGTTMLAPAKLVGGGATLAGKVGIGAGVGAAEGALYGFGSGEGGAGARGENALRGALVGGAAGAAFPAVIAGVKAGVVNPIASALNVRSDTRAVRAIETYLRRAGMTMDDLRAQLRSAADDGQPEFLAVDAMGPAGQRGLSGVTRQPGPARQMVTEALDQRQTSQGERVSAFLSDALDAPDTAQSRAASLTAARSNTANNAYDAARSGAEAVDVRGALGLIDDRLAEMGNVPIRGDSIDAKLKWYRARLAVPKKNLPKGTTSIELSNFERILGIKKDIGDDVDAAIRAGRGNEARYLSKLRDELDVALEASSAGYRAANDGFRRDSAAIRAVKTGGEMSRPGVRAADTTKTFAAMTPEEQAAFRAGYADPLQASVGAGAPGVNKARSLMSDKRAAELAAMAKDPALLNRQLTRENTMFSTRNQALGGSMTADNLADQADANMLSGSAVANALSGKFGQMTGAILDRMMAAASGTNPATREVIARALLSTDPAAELARAFPKARRNDAIEKMLSIVARASATRLGVQ